MNGRTRQRGGATVRDSYRRARMKKKPGGEVRKPRGDGNGWLMVIDDEEKQRPHRPRPSTAPQVVARR